MSMFGILAIGLLILFLSAPIKVLGEYERGVVFRLERVIDTKGPVPTPVTAPLWGNRQAFRIRCGASACAMESRRVSWRRRVFCR